MGKNFFLILIIIRSIKHYMNTTFKEIYLISYSYFYESNIQEINHWLGHWLCFSFSFRLIQISEFSSSIFSITSVSISSSEVSFLSLSWIISNFIWISEISFLDHGFRYLSGNLFTFDLISGCVLIICFAKNSHVLNFFSQCWHFQILSTLISSLLIFSKSNIKF